MSETEDQQLPSNKDENEVINIEDFKYDKILTDLKNAVQENPELKEAFVDRIRQLDREATQLTIDLGLGPDSKYAVVEFLGRIRQSRNKHGAEGDVLPFKKPSEK